jgi:hypothetical protein
LGCFNFGLWTWGFGLNGQPRFQILLETFLRLEIFGDDDDRPLRKKFLHQCGEKRLRGRVNAGKSQRSASLQSPRERLHSGSFDEVSEQVARRLCW